MRLLRPDQKLTASFTGENDLFCYYLSLAFRWSLVFAVRVNSKNEKYKLIRLHSLSIWKELYVKLRETIICARQRPSHANKYP